MFEKEIERYDRTVAEYNRLIVEPMGTEQYRERNEVIFSCHSCGIEGNTFTVDDTRNLFEQGLGYRPVGKSLLECTEMADHFAAYEWMHEHLDHAFDVELLKEVNHPASFQPAGTDYPQGKSWRVYRSTASDTDRTYRRVFSLLLLRKSHRTKGG